MLVWIKFCKKGAVQKEWTALNIFKDKRNFLC